jgi:Spy/CpxP family protein refolding chaperone
MKNIINLAAVGVLATGLMLGAQGQGTGTEAQGHGERRGNRIEMLATVLNLTDAQKEQAKTIFAGARQSSQSLRQDLRKNQDALAAAVKANDEAQIDSLAATQGNLTSQMTAIQAKAFASFYNILTPEQKEKADKLHQNMTGFFGHRGGPGMHGKQAQ